MTVLKNLFRQDIADMKHKLHKVFKISPYH